MKGFTLIEILAVMALVSLLIAGAVVAQQSFSERADAARMQGAVAGAHTNSNSVYLRLLRTTGASTIHVELTEEETPFGGNYVSVLIPPRRVLTAFSAPVAVPGQNTAVSNHVKAQVRSRLRAAGEDADHLVFVSPTIDHQINAAMINKRQLYRQ